MRFSSSRRPCLIAALSCALFLIVACDRELDAEQAARRISAWVEEQVQPESRHLQHRGDRLVSTRRLAEMLPNIEVYPIVTGPPDQADVESVEIFTSSEKSGKGNDGFFVEMARQFNAEKQVLSDGRTAAVRIRSITSGNSTAYMLSGRFLPDAFSPSHSLWAQMLSSDGIALDLIDEVTAPNIAGVVVREALLDQVSSDGKLDFDRLLANVTEGRLAMGYTSPWQSSTGLNFLITVLLALADGDERRMLSADVIRRFQQFQAGVPFIAQTTLQLRDAVQVNGVLDAMVMEYQSWVHLDDTESYRFLPFGVRHDSPLYATAEADSAEREVLRMFASYVRQHVEQAESFGFSTTPEHQDAWSVRDGMLLRRAQQLWKRNRSDSRPVATVFVGEAAKSDAPGSQKSLRQNLLDSAAAADMYDVVGMLSYGDTVCVCLPLARFDLAQESLFVAAVEQSELSGQRGQSVASDALLVAADMLLKFRDTHPEYDLDIVHWVDGSRRHEPLPEEVAKLLGAAAIPVHVRAY